MIMNGAGIFGIIRLWNDLKYVDGRAAALGKNLR
jgi:hypothetical protein